MEIVPTGLSTVMTRGVVSLWPRFNLFKASLLKIVFASLMAKCIPHKPATSLNYNPLAYC